MTRHVRRRVMAGVAGALALATLVLFVPPRGPRTLTHFDPARTAQLEVRMWQAYYGKSRVELFRLLTVQLREQYQYSWAGAAHAALYFARAASRFAEMRADYDRVLPDLTRAYAMARDWTDASFDPALVARAELAWWVARRTPGEQRAEQVGRRIAEEYALIYGVDVETLVAAGVLRARAGAVRDAAGARADWGAIGVMLDGDPGSPSTWASDDALAGAPGAQGSESAWQPRPGTPRRR
jgi:hypothetical protein